MYVKMVIQYMFILILCISGISYAFAEPLMVYTDKQIYNHGDHIVITITVQDVTGDNAIMHIRDSYNVTSSPIPIPVSDSNTVWSAPFPFEREVFAEDTYHVDVTYGDLFASTSFQIVDIGNVVVPIWVKQVAYLWANGEVSTSHYIDALENLQNLGIMQTSSDYYEDDPFIPYWLSGITMWWLGGLVSDDEYVTMMQYLADNGIIHGL